jgi:hypothetical protein
MLIDFPSCFELRLRNAFTGEIVSSPATLILCCVC